MIRARREEHPASSGALRALEVFARFARLGLSSFGGPVAHLGYFRREFVERAAWLDDERFAELVALCSALPGPMSSQVGIALGAFRAGPLGALLAWLAFTAPSALALGLLGAALHGTGGAAQGWRTSPVFAGALEGLTGAAAAVVALAVVQLARKLAAARATRVIALAAFILALWIDRLAPAWQWAPLAFGGLAGLALLPGNARLPPVAPLLRVPVRVGMFAFALLVIALLGLPLVSARDPYLGVFATFFRAGSLVFGGGHVVLPFLQTFVRGGDVPARDFFAGYGAAQSVPGPLFTFAAFLGAADRHVASPALGALVATLGIFAPSFLLLASAFPLWTALRDVPRAGAVLAGINASVVGLLGAVLVDPIGRTLLDSPRAVILGVAAFVLLQPLRRPAWLVVAVCACAGAALRAV